jgi:hypothetical protein
MNPVVRLPIKILPAHRSVEDIIAELEELFAETGDQCFSRAARTLNQATVSGRPSIDDKRALVEVSWLVENRKVGSLHEAFMRVAAAIEPDKNPRSVAERLRQKYFQNHPKNSIFGRTDPAIICKKGKQNMNRPLKVITENSQPIIPRLEDVSPEYAKLMAKQNELYAATKRLHAELETPDETDNKSRVAELLGDIQPEDIKARQASQTRYWSGSSASSCPAID